MRIYYAKTDIFSNEDIFERGVDLLPECRLQKLNRMKSIESRRQCVAAGVLLEYGLREHGLSGKNVTFLENSDGKPYILEQPALQYNLSHSGEYVAFVMSHFPVGIDIEKIRYGQEKLAKRFFSEEETKYLMECYSDTAFTQTWTRKEAFIKARGIGMRMPLDGFSTITDVIQINEKMPAEMRTANSVYYVNSYQISRDYWISVCQEGRQDEDLPVEVQLEDLF